MDPFSHGFVDIIAAEQTPDSSSWFQGTADAVRQAARHFRRYDADYYLILAGDHLYRMDYGRMLDAHVDAGRRHHGRRAAGDAGGRAGDGHLPLRSRRADRRVRGKAEPRSAGGDRQQRAAGHAVPRSDLRQPRSRSSRRWASTCSRARCCSSCCRTPTVTDFGREIIPAALNTHRVRAYLHDGYWADVGTVESFYDANIMLTEPHAPFKFYDPRKPTYTHERFLPPSHMRSCTVRESIVAEGCFLDECAIEQSVIGIRTHISRGTRITRSVLLGADMYDSGPIGAARHRPRRGARSRHHRQERVDRRRRAAGERSRRAARRRRRLLHPRRASSSCRRAAGLRPGQSCNVILTRSTAENSFRRQTLSLRSPGFVSYLPIFRRCAA